MPATPVETSQTPVKTGVAPPNTSVETGSNTGFTPPEIIVGKVGDPLTFVLNGQAITVQTPFAAHKEPTADQIAAVRFLTGIKDEQGRGVSRNFVIKRLFNSKGAPQTRFIKKCLGEE